MDTGVRVGRKAPDISGNARAAVRGLASGSVARFLAVGIASYLFDLGLLSVLHSVFGVALAVATSAAFAATLLFNFSLNKAFAFRSSGLVGPAFVKYLVLVVLNYGATVGVVTGLAAVGVPYAIAKTISTVVNAVANYVAYRWWVFRR